MSRESLLDDAIAKAKENEDWQLVEWLRMARGADSAVRWYMQKLRGANRAIIKLQAENDRLREEIDQWHRLTAGIELPEYPITEFQPKDLERENAKLRELVRDMWECIIHANEQDWFYFERHALGCGMSCTVNGEACGLSVFADRMKELGVDDG